MDSIPVSSTPALSPKNRSFRVAALLRGASTAIRDAESMMANALELASGADLVAQPLDWDFSACERALDALTRRSRTFVTLLRDPVTQWECRIRRALDVNFERDAEPTGDEYAEYPPGATAVFDGFFGNPEVVLEFAKRLGAVNYRIERRTVETLLVGFESEDEAIEFCRRVPGKGCGQPRFIEFPLVDGESLTGGDNSEPRAKTTRVLSFTGTAAPGAPGDGSAS